MNYWEAAHGNLLNVGNVIYLDLIGGYTSMYIGKNSLSLPLVLVPVRLLLFFKDERKIKEK